MWNHRIREAARATHKAISDSIAASMIQGGTTMTRRHYIVIDIPENATSDQLATIYAVIDSNLAEMFGEQYDHSMTADPEVAVNWIAA